MFFIERKRVTVMNFSVKIKSCALAQADGLLGLRHGQRLLQHFFPDLVVLAAAHSIALHCH
jgi:hypothetical protein